jgi:hypothetical protein
MWWRELCGSFQMRLPSQVCPSEQVLLTMRRGPTVRYASTNEGVGAVWWQGLQRFHTLRGRAYLCRRE